MTHTIILIREREKRGRSRRRRRELIFPLSLLLPFLFHSPPPLCISLTIGEKEKEMAEGWTCYVPVHTNFAQVESVAPFLSAFGGKLVLSPPPSPS